VLPPAVLAGKTGFAASLLRAEGGSMSQAHGETSLKSKQEVSSAVISSSGIRYISSHSRDHTSAASAVQTQGAHPGTAHERAEQYRASHKRAPVAKPEIPSSAEFVSTVHASAAGADVKIHEKPNMTYFSVGMVAFLATLVLTVLSTRMLNFLQEDTGMLAEGNPQGDEDEPERRAISRNVTHPGDQIPHRMQQVLISWIFITASFAYFMVYLALQAGLPQLQHWCGVVASLVWLMGFLILLHWQISEGSSKAQQISTVFKALACFFGQVHPAALIMGCKESDPGVWWPPVLGIFLWHFGNIVASVDYYFTPPEGTDRNASILSHRNLPVTEAWIDQSATWLLLIAAFSITHWLGKDEDQLLPTSNWAVTLCQFGGVTLWLLASILKCEWCNGFRNCSHRPEQQIEQ